MSDETARAVAKKFLDEQVDIINEVSMEEQDAALLAHCLAALAAEREWCAQVVKDFGADNLPGISFGAFETKYGTLDLLAAIRRTP